MEIEDLSILYCYIQAMVFILMLFIIFMYLFAIMGVMFFREAYVTYSGRVSFHNPAENYTLKYPESFM